MENEMHRLYLHCRCDMGLISRKYNLCIKCRSQTRC